MKLTWTDKALPWLTAQAADTIFDCVYGVDDALRQRHPLLGEPAFADLVDTLLAMQRFNVRHRTKLLEAYWPMFEEVLGELEQGSEGAWMWLGLGLAIRDLYDMRRETLKGLLRQVTVRK